MARTWLRLFAGATLSLSVAGHALAEEGKITVFAAASLTNAMQDIAAAYKKEKNVDVVSSFAPSCSDLSRLISSGRLNCTIDKVNGIVETNRRDRKNAQYDQVIKQGDLLLNCVSLFAILLAWPLWTDTLIPGSASP